ncbi:MAG: MFS transporter [Lentisphaerae bacterium GWF2_49_21]|nr:MAG: MFS transporter [Lentisphaerae bacterium GWF2_49_21]
MSRSPWFWVPSLYYAEGLPYVLVMTVSVIMYKNLGISNNDIAFYTSWLYLPWVIKPLWSPIVEIFRTKRFWIYTMQFIVAAAFASVALTVPAPDFFKITLVIFWLMAFSSATHDIAADGFYIMGLDTHDQAWFVGIRNTFYRLASITGQGLLVILAGKLAKLTGNMQYAWSVVFVILAVLFAIFALYHMFILPRPETDVPSKVVGSTREFFIDSVQVFADFFRKKYVLSAIAFILLYRLGESQLLKLATPFMLDERASGGLQLATENIGVIYGTIGVAMLLLGGILGGFTIARFGLKSCILWMALAINLPDLVYVYMSYCMPENLAIIASCVAFEQLGYGFGFAAYMLYMVYFAEDSQYKTAHYAIMTGFMALGMMVPGMFSGKIQESMGYPLFFIWVCICTIPGFLAILFLKIDPEFGKKK